MTEANMTLEGTVAIVTGASRGIGRATAVTLATAGAHVVCASRSTAMAPSKIPGTIDETARQVVALGRRALAIGCDLSREEQVDALIQRTVDEFGRIDILVNNAAVNYAAPLCDISTRHWDLVLNVNLRGAVLCTKACLPHLLRQPRASIVNVSSGAAVDAALAAQFRIAAYAVSKAGLEMFTKVLAAELQTRAVAVNALRIETSVASEGAIAFNPGADSSAWEKPETVANQILWLITRGPAYSGHVLSMEDVRREMAGDPR